MRNKNEPGQRSGRGAHSLQAHIAADALRNATPGGRVLHRAAHCVLVVDDNEAMCYALARSLRAGGYSTREAASGLEALARLPGAAALLLDVELPDLDGMEVCRLVRANPASANIPIVHISARHADAADLMESSRAGADTFLPLPVEPEQLLAVIDALLLRRQA